MAHQTDGNRLTSLDVFRGLTIAGMVLVNSPGTWEAVSPQLRHAEWNGWTFTDTIFPLFLFIVGVAIVFSLEGRREKGDSLKTLELRIVKRSLILFALGLVVNSFPLFHLATIRIPGVLQRIALCYLFAASITLGCSIRGQLLWLVGLLAAYWVAMLYIPIPGIGAGVLNPGENFASWCDSLLLQGHMWSHYETWDPEGLGSTAPAIATVLFGVMAGRWLRSKRSGREKAAGMFLAGLALIAAGELAGRWFPVNKNIWSDSFSILMAGIGAACLALVYWIVDVKGWKRGTAPFLAFGMNPIFIYVASELSDELLRSIWFTMADGGGVNVRDYLYHTFFAPLAGPQTASLLFATCYVLAMLVPAWIMMKRKWFIKV
jgi:predicted acyltransferase